VKMEPTECSETSAFNIQTPGKYPEENLPYLQHGESLKIMLRVFDYICTLYRPAYFVHYYIKMSAGYVKCYSILYLIFLLLLVSVESYFVFPLLTSTCASLFRP
jgi:hypothetical protein